MEIKSKSKIDESAKSGNLKEAIRDVNNSSLNIFNEGIRRVDLHKINKNNRQQSEANGFLVIDSGNKEGDNKHIALKANSDTFWTISVANDGASLNIGQFKIGETEIKPIIVFKEDTSLTLYKSLNVNALKSAYKLEDNETDNTKSIRGIATTGFTGFKSGTVKADGKYQPILEIPKESFGKYKVEAWVVNKQGKGVANLENTFVFFSDKYPKVINPEKFNSVGFFKRQLMRLHHWFLKNRQDYIVYNTSDESITSNRILQLASRLKIKAEQKVIYNEDSGKREVQFQIIVKTNFTPINCKIYYSIERIWEGSNWINIDMENNIQQPTEQPIQ